MDTNELPMHYGSLLEAKHLHCLPQAGLRNLRQHSRQWSMWGIYSLATCQMFLGTCVHVSTGSDRGHPVLNLWRHSASRSEVRDKPGFVNV